MCVYFVGGVSSIICIDGESFQRNVWKKEKEKKNTIL